MKIKASSQIDYLRQKLQELADSCTPLWHPLGFVSCVIRDEPNQCVVRIHFWPKYERRTKNPNWPIHTHAYDLSSLVLAGRVRDMQYITKEGSEYALYSVSYRGDDSSISWTGREASIVLDIDRYHLAGEEYSVPVGSFHQTHVPLGESAITLVTLSNFQNESPLVLGQPDNRSYPYDRVSFSKEVFWQSINHAMASYISKAS